MYLLIDETAYTDLMNLSYAPQVDITCDTLPIDVLTCDIITSDTIDVAQLCDLYDDMDQLWTSMWLTAAEDMHDGRVRITAKSMLSLLDNIQLEETMLEEAELADVLDDTIHALSYTQYTIGIEYETDAAFDSVTLSGYLPNQTARERLQQICMVIGAYIQSVYTDILYVRPIGANTSIIPIEDTYWKPTWSSRDVVTGVSLKYYTFTDQTQTPEELAADTDSYMFPEPWVCEESELSLTNPYAPAGINENTNEVDGVYLINAGNANDILNRLATYWFEHREIDLACINNRQYAPGDFVQAYLTPDIMVQGYIQSCQFAFGMQARANLHIAAVDIIECAKLTVNGIFNRVNVMTREYTFPVGYGYTFDMPYLDINIDQHRYILRPMTPTITGTLSEDATINVQYAAALDLVDDTLEIISVDGVTVETGDEVIGVIE